MIKQSAASAAMSMWLDRAVQRPDDALSIDNRVVFEQIRRSLWDSSEQDNQGWQRPAGRSAPICALAAENRTAPSRGAGRNQYSPQRKTAFFNEKREV